MLRLFVTRVLILYLVEIIGSNSCVEQHNKVEILVGTSCEDKLSLLYTTRTNSDFKLTQNNGSIRKVSGVTYQAHIGLSPHWYREMKFLVKSLRVRFLKGAVQPSILTNLLDTHTLKASFT